MRTRWFAALSLAVATGLAGCTGGSEADAEDQVFEDLDLQVSATTGVIRGVVVDDAIRPVANASVTLTMPSGEPDRTAVTAATGAFGFDALAQGTYFLFVERAGFLPSQTSADVVAGVREPPIVKVLLALDTSFVAPFFQQLVFEGFIECSMGGAAGGPYVYYSACSTDMPVTGQPLFSNDRFNNVDILTGYPDWLQAEMTWESTQALSRSLAHNIHYPDPDHADGQNDHSVEGESPLLNAMNATVAKEYLEGEEFTEGDNLTYRQRVFTRATDGLGPALTLSQRFTVYTTIFYGYVPPEGWSFLATGEVPPPPT